MKVVFIVNPISGTKDKNKILELIPTIFSGEEWDFKIQYTERAGHAVELAKAAAESGADAAIAIGGDGTVNEVARGLIHTNTALGIIPCGSGNGLARHLGISMKPSKAIETIKKMNIKDCDYGLICGHPFFCTAGVGLDAEVSEQFAKDGKRGLLTYIKKTINISLKYSGMSCVIELENGKKLSNINAWLITGANASQYGNNFFIAPKAAVCDGYLDINIWTCFNKLRGLLIAPLLRTGYIELFKNVKIMRARKITIHRRSEGPIHWDGDPSNGPKDITMECVEKGIKMIVGTPSKNQL